MVKRMWEMMIMMKERDTEKSKERETNVCVSRVMVPRLPYAPKKNQTSWFVGVVQWGKRTR